MPTNPCAACAVQSRYRSLNQTFSAVFNRLYRLLISIIILSTDEQICYSPDLKRNRSQPAYPRCECRILEREEKTCCTRSGLVCE
jgi:hypothetical protein